MGTGQLKAFWLTSDREDDTRMEEAKERIKADKSKKNFMFMCS